jgi:hypothetical protein
MHRQTARLLLIFVLVGNLVPLALAATAAPPRACCLRKGVHHCQDSLTAESEQLAVGDASCCNHGCRRAVTTAQWAHAQPKPAPFFVPTTTSGVTKTEPNSPASATAEFQSSRAPPAC